MKGGLPIGIVAATLLAIAPNYLVERIVDYLFLTSSPAFPFWSGARVEIFLASIVLAAILAGYLVEGLLAASAAFILGIVILLFLLYLFCNRHVCFSTGIDGLEPLRVGYFFAALALLGSATGSYARTRTAVRGLSFVPVGVALFTAIAYYPVIFTIARVRILAPLDPWAVTAFVGVLSFATASRVTAQSGWKAGLSSPLLASALLLGLAVGIAGQYLALILPQVALLGVSILIGSGLGVATSPTFRPSGRRRWWVVTHPLALDSNKVLAILVSFVLLTTLVFLPDAAAGVEPVHPSSGAASAFTFGRSVYVGGLVVTDSMHSLGVSLGVNFSGTSPSVIQSDNYLAAGIGVHSPDCCVDGIDYGYRFDVYAFHDGSEALVASAWEICDFNMACGGHSWQRSMLLHAERIGTPAPSSIIRLAIQWRGREVYWWSGYGTVPLENFTSFRAPDSENPYFNVDASEGGGLQGVEHSGVFFFQFGLMSRYPIGHPGWNVTFECPAYLQNGSWRCAEHAASLQGGQSFWKALWRWGENYAGLGAAPDASHESVTFSDSRLTLRSFQTFW